MHGTLLIRFGLVPVLALCMISPCSAQEPVAEPPHSAVSQVRIVRLSQAEGQVQLDRGTAGKYEPAFVNLPIVEGERLRTLDGLAEVEFEDNSSLRLTPQTEIEFPALGREASGATISRVKLVSGSLYMNLVNAKGSDSVTLSVGNETVSLTPGSHLRIDVTPPSASLAVFNGSVTLTDPTGTLVVGKKKTVNFDTVSGAAPVFAKNEPEARFDKWDKEAVDYHKARASAASFAGSPYAYGLNDLGYYGSFADLSGCGILWRPYLASTAWDPYGSGVWSYYPGSGYSWVSPYPWAWAPYHSGSWQYCPSAGWGWRPSRSWNGLNNQPSIRVGQGGRTLPTPRQPRRGEPTLVPVNIKALPVSRVESGSTFVFRDDSAGLGVPRSVFGNLGKISESVSQKGVATSGLSDSQAQRGFIAISRPAPSAAPASGNAHGFSAPASGSGSGLASSGSSMSSSGSHAGGGPSGAGGGHH